MRQEYLNQSQKQMGNTVGSLVSYFMPAYGVGRMVGQLASSPLAGAESNADAMGNAQNKAVGQAAQENGMQSGSAPNVLNAGWGPTNDWLQSMMPGHSQLMGGVDYSAPPNVSGATADPKQSIYGSLYRRYFNG